MAQFRSDIHKASTAANGIWRLVRWAKERSHLPPEPPIIPTLREVREGVVQEANTVQEKADVLRRRFFPGEPEVDMRDMEGYVYPQPVEPLPQISPEEVRAVIDSK